MAKKLATKGKAKAPKVVFGNPEPINNFPLDHQAQTGPGRVKYWNDERIEELADKLLEWLKKPTSPWFEGFAIDNNFSLEYMSRFAKQNEKFRDAYEYAKSWQKHQLIAGGLLNKYNAMITKLILSANFGVKEQSEIHHQGAAPVEIVHFGKEEPKKWPKEIEMQETE